MSDISLQRYVTASAGGMLPCQSLHAYIGSTLRSMEEVVSSSSSSTAAYIVFGGQVCDHMLLILLHCHLCDIVSSISHCCCWCVHLLLSRHAVQYQSVPWNLL